MNDEHPRWLRVRYYVFESGIESSQFPVCQPLSSTSLNRGHIPPSLHLHPHLVLDHIQRELGQDLHLLFGMTICRLFNASLNSQNVVIGFRIPER